MDTNESSPSQGSGKSQSLSVPFAIVAAGALVAFAIYSQGPAAPAPAGDNNPGAAAVGGAFAAKEVNGDDHLRGNPDAAVKIVEYSDLECPFCKTFHKTMLQVMDEYGNDGRVAWVYRHLPLDQIHPKARKEAEASECAAKLGGNDAFWQYIDKIFEITPANNGLDHALLPQIAQDLGLDRAAFEACLSGGEFAQKISDQMQDAAAAGAQGTPYSVIITKDGKTIPINGALPYPSVKAMIDQALATE
ncbi:MAG: thioredoxin domain-containing protein [Patescibacteria group bacterium]